MFDSWSCLQQYVGGKSKWPSFGSTAYRWNPVSIFSFAGLDSRRCPAPNATSRGLLVLPSARKMDCLFENAQSCREFEETHGWGVPSERTRDRRFLPTWHPGCVQQYLEGYDERDRRQRIDLFFFATCGSARVCGRLENCELLVSLERLKSNIDYWQKYSLQNAACKQGFQDAALPNLRRRKADSLRMESVA